MQEAIVVDNVEVADDVARASSATTSKKLTGKDQKPINMHNGKPALSGLKAALGKVARDTKTSNERLSSAGGSSRRK